MFSRDKKFKDESYYHQKDYANFNKSDNQQSSNKRFLDSTTEKFKTKEKSSDYIPKSTQNSEKISITQHSEKISNSQNFEKISNSQNTEKASNSPVIQRDTQKDDDSWDEGPVEKKSKLIENKPQPNVKFTFESEK